MVPSLLASCTNAPTRDTALAQVELLMTSFFPDQPDRLIAKKRLSEIQAILTAG
ncbi:hypothetical protein [Roseovarius sp. 2305UL8-3]|uniref:hypothetical protein n=1 Tax=Roseovarius conchicola TaxID=3121636 RepID=UPI00352836E7